ncbi:hypothetical protein H0261_18505 [Pectobacterium versatile]|uniref:hypothetical protein n=2 Tax=Pectobacterium TaxID=122277 RepID=UPI000501FF0D|nr:MULTISPECIES: hypothetical protein [Pectobacterium]KAA3665622.1 hypothetical protein FEV48_21385 [Pectobacterium carotovorum subsp. carotovorum]KGA31775.1 hypothetical protein KS43_18050 [Pectobacterium odoriferum]MBA0185734.1 hypothetical protein [Pectobacterium versatile]MBD0844935.1 hypothetical protein [Pectobacterium carotovorum subsp. carotovorum]MBL0867597.1 hypothetical protein [Pectobacterium carotovorum]
MMLTSECKTVMRWGGIALVSFAYYLWLFLAIFPLDDKSPMLQDKVVTIEYHEAVIENIYKATDNVIAVALIGFPVCMSLILIIFKKVR